MKTILNGKLSEFARKINQSITRKILCLIVMSIGASFLGLYHRQASADCQRTAPQCVPAASQQAPLRYSTHIHATPSPHAEEHHHKSAPHHQHRRHPQIPRHSQRVRQRTRPPAHATHHQPHVHHIRKPCATPPVRDESSGCTRWQTRS